MSEAEFQTQVMRLAKLQGWEVLHVRKSREQRGNQLRWVTTTSIIGWPDLFLFHPERGGFYGAELKSDTGAVEADQRVVLAKLLGAGIPAGVWRPKDWPTIQAFLTGRAGPPFVARQEI